MACLKSRTLYRKVLTDKVNLNAADPDAVAAAEKHPLRILIIIIIVVIIIIILWYNKDIRLPVQAPRGVQWFAVAMVQWSPLGFAVGSTHLSINQPSVRSLQGWEGLNEAGSVSSHWFPMGGQCKSVQQGNTLTCFWCWLTRLALIINGSCTVGFDLPLALNGIFWFRRKSVEDFQCGHQ